MGAMWRHFMTVCKHRWYVFKECAACGIWWQGITHDMSKFSRAEFIPSAKHFQGHRSPIEAEKEEDGYSAAWMHHKGRNPHHWEYWIDFNDKGEIIANKIPYKYVVEMVCDWIGAGKAYSGEKWTKKSPYEYYLAHRAGRHFHPDTECMLVAMLERIYDHGLDSFHEWARLKRESVWMPYSSETYAEVKQCDE